MNVCVCGHKFRQQYSSDLSKHIYILMLFLIHIRIAIYP